MISQPDSPAQAPKPRVWPGPGGSNRPPHEALAGFIHRPTEDPAGRTVAVTSLVMALWQLGGRRMSGRPPSMVIVNADADATDPNDTLASHLLATPASEGPRVYHEGYFTGGTPEMAPAAMVVAIGEKLSLGKVTACNASTHAALERRYFDAQRTGFGCGPARAYASAWHGCFGLLTDRAGEIILRLDSQSDRQSFRDDVLACHERLRSPVGYGPGLELVPKTTAVSGSLPVGMWDAGLAGALVELGLPALVLPSLAAGQLERGELPALEVIASASHRAPADPVEELASYIPEAWFAVYRDELRERLRHLPADYEYSIHKMAREIFPVCERIAGWCGCGASRFEVEALWLELCMHTLRGLVLGVAGLAWHVLGFDPGCPRAEALRVLEYLRERGPMTKSELLRRAHLKKGLRDTLVARFEAEGLVRVDGGEVAATSYREFVEALYSGGELPQPADLRGALAEMGKSPE